MPRAGLTPSQARRVGSLDIAGKKSCGSPDSDDLLGSTSPVALTSPPRCACALCTPHWAVRHRPRGVTHAKRTASCADWAGRLGLSCASAPVATHTSRQLQPQHHPRADASASVPQGRRGPLDFHGHISAHMPRPRTPPPRRRRASVRVSYKLTHQHTSLAPVPVHPEAGPGHSTCHLPAGVAQRGAACGPRWRLRRVHMASSTKGPP